MSDTDATEDEWVTGNVDHNPEVTRCLGQFLTQFATLEASLIWMLSIVLGGRDKDQIAFNILGTVQGVKARCDIVEGAAAAADIPEHVKGGILSFVEEIRKMNTVRNEYVHAVYETNTRTGEVRLTAFALSTTRKHKKKAVDPGELERDTVIMLSKEIAEAFWDEEPAAAAPESSPETPA
jgi:hypothetical protein